MTDTMKLIKMRNKLPALTEKQEFIEVFEHIIDYLIDYKEDIVTDDLLVEMLQDFDHRQEAFNMLMTWLESEGYER